MSLVQHSYSTPYVITLWLANTRPHVLQIRSNPCTDAGLLRGRVDRDKDQVCLLDRTINIGGKEEVAAAGLADDVIEAWLVDWQGEISRVPSIDAGLVEVHNGYLDMRALESDNCARRATLWMRE